MQAFTEWSYPERREEARVKLHQYTCSHSDVPELIPKYIFIYVAHLLNSVAQCGLILQDMPDQKAGQAGEPSEAGALFQS